jgi:Ca2+:H+ antiporter
MQTRVRFHFLTLLIGLFPVAILVRYVPALHNDVALFIIAGLGIVPLAHWIGKATDQIATRLGQGIGGLLNATFGNAAELILAVMALSKGLTGVVKASLTGSIIGNTLLVLGLSAFLGGLKRKRQTFNAVALRMSATTLMLAAVALVIPTVFHVTAKQRTGTAMIDAERNLSIFIGIVLILSYGALLLFSLKTHRHSFSTGTQDSEAVESAWSMRKSLAILLGSTVGVSVLSEFLVGSIESARQAFGFTDVFVGVIVVAIVGNAAEHSSAVRAALDDKMDLAIAIAIGSSLQIALFVAPVVMFCSYLFGHGMTFQFSLPEIVAVIISVLLLAQISADGESNWFEGALLLAVYVIIAGLFFLLPPPQ